MKIKWFSFFLLIPLLSSSQKYEDDMEAGFLLRGKVLGSVMLEDWWIVNITAGIEYRFNKNFSIGADFVHINNIYEQEQYNDTTRPDYYVEYARKTPRTCLLADIRFYPFQDLFYNSRFKPYLSAFTKIGKAHQFAKPEWKFLNDDIFKQKEHFYDIGLTAGLHWGFKNGQGGLDMNIGYCQRFIKEDVEYYVEGGPNRLVYDQQVRQSRLAGRVNLFIYLWSK